MSNKGPYSFKGRIKSIRYAMNGVKLFFQTEHNSWIHLAAAIVVIVLAILVELNTSEWCWIVAAIAIVFTAEIFNTAIELFTDMVSPEYSERAKKIKDLSAGAVLIVAMMAAIIGSIIFLPKLCGVLHFVLIRY